MELELVRGLTDPERGYGTNRGWKAGRGLVPSRLSWASAVKQVGQPHTGSTRVCWAQTRQLSTLTASAAGCA